MLGLTVDLATLPDADAWLVGLAIAAILAFVVRPMLVGLVLLPVRLTRGERVFVLWSGLKGAVPILLGTYIVSAGASFSPPACAIFKKRRCNHGLESGDLCASATGSADAAENPGPRASTGSPNGDSPPFHLDRDTPAVGRRSFPRSRPATRRWATC